MNRAFNIAAALMLLLVGVAGIATADDNGRIAVGALSATINDAPVDGDVGPFTGVTGDRVDGLADHVGLAFTLTATDLTGLADVDICFHDEAGAQLECHFAEGDESGTVPVGTSYAWVLVYTGVDIEYSLSFS